jgi:hypothetical protein
MHCDMNREVRVVEREVFRERECDFDRRPLAPVNEQHAAIAAPDHVHPAAPDLHCTGHEAITKGGGGGPSVDPTECVKPTEIDIETGEPTLARATYSHFDLRHLAVVDKRGA